MHGQKACPWRLIFLFGIFLSMREKNKNEGSECGDEAHNKPSILKALFSSQYLTYLDVVESEGLGNLSSVVKDTFDAFAKCGSMTEGFAYLRCDTCEEFQVCGFSCKRRGFCPRCASRRGASHEVHLMDNVFPEVDVRQWVMTYPPQIRYLMATNREAMSLVHRVSEHEIGLYYRRRGRQRLGIQGQTGSVSFIQMAGSALNLAPHAHSLFVDGVFVENSNGIQIFHSLPPSPSDIEHVLSHICSKVFEALQQRDLLEKYDSGEGYVYNIPDRLAPWNINDLCAAASIGYRSALGERKGKGLRKVGWAMRAGGDTSVSAEGGYLQNGFSIHCDRRVKGHQRDKLRKLVGYVSRPMVPESRLSWTEDGLVELELKRKWDDGTTAIQFDPLEMIEKLACLVPHRWKNLVIYSGCFAPNSGVRDEIVPDMEERRNTAGNRSWYIPWAELLAKTFGKDLFTCPNCDSRRRVLMLITHKELIGKILASLGISPDPPSFSPSRYDRLVFDSDDFQND